MFFFSDSVRPKKRLLCEVLVSCCLGFLGTKYRSYECPNPFKTFINLALVDAVVTEINETTIFEGLVNAGRNLRTISSRTMKKGAEIYQRDVGCIKA